MFNLTATISLVDQMTAPMRKMSSQMNSFTKQTNYTRDANGRLRDEMGRYVGSGNKMSGALGGVTGSLMAFAGAAGAAGVAMSSVKKAMDFESQMSKVGAIAGASNSELLQLKDSAMQLGAATTKSATEVAQSMQELAAKGFDTNKIIGAMPGIIKAAEASGQDLATTSDVITSALNAFNMKASDSTHIADVLAMTANQSAAGIEDMGFAFKYAAPVANGLGLRLEELSAATGLMVDKGLAGEQAGTSLRMGLMRLADAPEQASKAMNAMGFSAIDSAGKFKSITTITNELRKSMNGMTDAQKVSTLNTIFGAEAATGWLGLIDSAPGKMKKMTDALVNSNGTASSTSKKMLDNAAGAVELLKGSIETLQLKLGTALLPTIQEGAKAFSSWMDGMKPEQIQGWADSIKNAGQMALKVASYIKNNWNGISSTILAIAAATVTMKVGLKGLMILSTVTKLLRAYRAGTLAATAAELGFNVALLANPMTWVVVGIAALIAAGILLWRNWDKVSAGMSAAWDVIKSGAETAMNFIIGKINSMIEVINLIPGVSIPIVPKVDWTEYKAPSAGPLKMTVNTKTKPVNGQVNKIPVNPFPKSTNITTYTPTNKLLGGSFAVGTNSVPRDMVAKIHAGEMIIPRKQSELLRNSGVNIGNVTSLSDRGFNYEPKVTAGNYDRQAPAPKQAEPRAGQTVNLTTNFTINNTGGEIDRKQMEKIANYLADGIREAGMLGA